MQLRNLSNLKPNLLCLRDENYGYQLYMSDPSGNYSGWKATAIGANHQAATNILKQDYKEDMTLDKAVALIMRVLSKSMDTSLSPEKVELCSLRRDEATGRVSSRISLLFAH